MGDMEESYMIVEDGEGSDAGSDTKLLPIASDKKTPVVIDIDASEGDTATTSTPNLTGTPVKSEKEEEGEQDSEQDDPTGL